MKCVICKHGETELGFMTATFEQENTTLVFKGVPADICQICGESYLSQETTTKLLKQAKAAVRKGLEVEVRKFIAA